MKEVGEGERGREIERLIESSPKSKNVSVSSYLELYSSGFWGLYPTDKNRALFSAHSSWKEKERTKHK